MDIARPDLARKRKLWRGLYAGVAAVVVVLITVGVSRLEPAAPRVDRDTVYLDTVQRGPMVRQVRGTGTLVPEAIRWIPATTEGTVERIVIRPGAAVTPDTVIVELRNAELEQTALEAALQLRAAEARYLSRTVELDSQLLSQRAALATVESDLTQAMLQREADQQLADRGLVSTLTLKQSEARARELATRYELEQERLRITTASVQAPPGGRASGGRPVHHAVPSCGSIKWPISRCARGSTACCSRCPSTRASALPSGPTWPASVTRRC